MFKNPSIVIWICHHPHLKPKFPTFSFNNKIANQRRIFIFATENRYVHKFATTQFEIRLLIHGIQQRMTTDTSQPHSLNKQTSPGINLWCLRTKDFPQSSLLFIHPRTVLYRQLINYYNMPIVGGLALSSVN